MLLQLLLFYHNLLTICLLFLFLCTSIIFPITLCFKVFLFTLYREVFLFLYALKFHLSLAMNVGSIYPMKLNALPQGEHFNFMNGYSDT